MINAPMPELEALGNGRSIEVAVEPCPADARVGSTTIATVVGRVAAALAMG